jgi:hypothetical protein
MEHTIFVWLPLSVAVIGGLMILIAGFLLGLGCGLCGRDKVDADPEA